jgi:hypothetical protein
MTAPDELTVMRGQLQKMQHDLEQLSHSVSELQQSTDNPEKRHILHLSEPTTRSMSFYVQSLALIVAAITIVFGVIQLKHQASSSTAQSRSQSSSAYASIINQGIQLDSVFAAHPELEPYYEGQSDSNQLSD